MYTKTLHLRLRQGKNSVRLLGTSLNTKNATTLGVQQCFIAWNLRNIHSENNTIIKRNAGGDTTVTIPSGYYTFNELKKFLEQHQIIIDYGRDSQITIFCEAHSLILNNFGPLLGFEKNEAITLNTKVISQLPAQMTNGLKEIRIHAPDLVDDALNFSKVGTMYRPTSLLLALGIDTTQSLNGTITHYDTRSVKIACKTVNQDFFTFMVESLGKPNDYEIFLTLEINL